MRVRTAISKREEVRFISHLDMVRALERAIRRSGLPVAYSEGFHPHPKVSFASAVPVGMTSQAEYVDIELTVNMEAIDILDCLGRALPPGLRLEAVGYTNDKVSLASRIEYASYEVRMATDARILDAVREFMNSRSVSTTKRTKSGEREEDIRPLVKSLEAEDYGLSMLIAAGSRASLRPDDLIACIARMAGRDPRSLQPRIHRSGLYVQSDHGLVMPMDTGCFGVVVAGDPRSEMNGEGHRCQL